jgi:hypothetical protein
MTYVGIQTQIRRNNFNSVLLIIAFPLVLLGMVYAFLFFTSQQQDPQLVNDDFKDVVPFVILGTSIWFAIAWFLNLTLNTSILRSSARRRSVSNSMVGSDSFYVSQTILKCLNCDVRILTILLVGLDFFNCFFEIF